MKKSLFLIAVGMLFIVTVKAQTAPKAKPSAAPSATSQPTSPRNSGGQAPAQTPATRPGQTPNQAPATAPRRSTIARINVRNKTAVKAAPQVAKESQKVRSK